MPADAFTGDWRDPVVTHDGDCPKRGRRRCLGVDPSLPRLAAPVVGQGRVSAEHREGSLEAPRVLPDHIGGATRAPFMGLEPCEFRDQRRGRDRARSESQGVPVLYLLHRFREGLEHLERQNHWKFLQIWQSWGASPLSARSRTTRDRGHPRAQYVSLPRISSRSRRFSASVFREHSRIREFGQNDSRRLQNLCFQIFNRTLFVFPPPSPFSTVPVSSQRAEDSEPLQRARR